MYGWVESRANLYEQNIQPGDEIVISIMEHHSNLIPWQQLQGKVLP